MFYDICFMNEEKPLINILIRTSNRPTTFMRLLNSITDSDYPNIRIIVGYDNEQALRYIPKGLETIFVSADRSLPYWYDEYCNILSELVTEGYYFYADDDDKLIDSNVLSRLPLTGPGLIVQLQRQNNIVPRDLNYRKGQIGMPCLILHHSLKKVAYIKGNGAGDYFWIKEVTSQIEIPFVPIVVVYSFAKGNGKC